MIFFFGRLYLTGDDGYQNFLVFVSMLNSLKLDNNKKVTNSEYTEYHLKRSNQV